MQKIDYPVVIKLGEGKWWIGKSTDPESYIRICEEGRSSLSCIKKYGYKKAWKVEDYKIEDVITKYVEKYGAENVKYGNKRFKSENKNKQKRSYPMVINLKNNKFWIGQCKTPEIYKVKVSDGRYNIKCVKEYGLDSIETIEDATYEETIKNYTDKYGHENVLYSRKPIEIENQIDNLVLLNRKNEQKLYILSLENDYWYIGVTQDIEKRIKQHQEGKGAEWTKIHKPTGEYVYQTLKSIFEEDYMVEHMMFYYGMEKVRGGSYCRVDLDMFQREVLRRKFNHAKNGCICCGSNGHYIKDCENFICSRCGNSGHSWFECPDKNNEIKDIISHIRTEK